MSDDTVLDRLSNTQLFSVIAKVVKADRTRVAARVTALEQRTGAGAPKPYVKILWRVEADHAGVRSG